MKIENILNNNFTFISDPYRKFALEKDQCRRCSVYPEYEQVGQSEGNADDPTFMFIGEALGKDEVEQVRPFIGRAGQRLREELRGHPKVFNKNNCLITNTLSCRPKNNKFPKSNTGPYSLSEVEGAKLKGCTADKLVNTCADLWVRREISILRPQVVVTLGSIALQYIIGDRGITSNRGKWKFIEKYRIWALPTYHPSYVLRCEYMDSHVVDQFSEDIAKVANTWHTVVGNDRRMKITRKQYDTEREKVEELLTNGGIEYFLGSGLKTTLHMSVSQMSSILMDNLKVVVGILVRSMPKFVST